MELIKKNVHMNRVLGKTISQVTIEDDVNVPDSKDDIELIVKEMCNIKMDSVRVQNGRISVRGKLDYKLLYIGSDKVRMLHKMNGEVAIEEQINVNSISEDDSVSVNTEIEDCNVSIINSRKINIRAIITFTVNNEKMCSEEAAIDISDDENVEFIKQPLELANMVICKKDIYRIKEEIEIPGNRPNISELLWDSVDLRNAEVKLLDGKLSLRGELAIFALYNPVDDNAPIQWLESTIPFGGTIDLGGCDESMLSNVSVNLGTIDIENKPDYDGEERIIGVDVVLDLDIKVYQDEAFEIVKDVYSSSMELTPVTKVGEFDNILMKNSSKCRINNKAKVENTNGSLLQVCNCEGKMKIDDVQIVEDAIQVEGALEVSILYVSSEDKYPLNAFATVIPFSHKIETDGIDENCTYTLKKGIEQLSTVMISNNEMEIRATLALEAFVICKSYEPIIVDVEQTPLNIEKMQAMPGIVGYMVREEDTLWKIAKRYYTTVDNIKRVNNLTSDMISPGERLIVVKEVS